MPENSNFVGGRKILLQIFVSRGMKILSYVILMICGISLMNASKTSTIEDKRCAHKPRIVNAVHTNCATINHFAPATQIIKSFMYLYYYSEARVTESLD